MTQTAPQVQDAGVLRKLARQFTLRLDEVKQDFVGRDEAVDMLGLAMLCREHLLLLGPPGTAKTALIERLRAVFAADNFAYLLTRYTEPAELFGPMDLKWFQDKSEYRINSKGMLPDAHIAFLDEVFHGSSAILNALLTLINERKFHDGSRLRPAKLLTLLGSSNDIPDDPVLAAFSDRFLLRGRLEYVADDAMEELLTKGWRAERDLIRDTQRESDGSALAVAGEATRAARTHVGFPLDDVRTLQQAVATVDLAAVREPLSGIVRAMRAEGVAFSDRRAVKAQKVIAAHAVLDERGVADLSDLSVLAYMWAEPRDEASVRRILDDNGVPVADAFARVRDIEDIALDRREIGNRVSTLAYSEEYREVLRLLQGLANELLRDHPGADAELNRVRELQRTVLEAARERYTWDGNSAES